MDEIRLLNYLKGELSEEEILQVEAWYEASPDNKKMLEQLYYTMFIGERAAVMESVDVEKSLNRLKTAIKRKEDATTKIRSAKWKRYVFPLAAFFTGIVLTVGLSYITLNNKVSNYIVATPAGQRAQFVLPDGSKVCLNSSTQLSYRNSFWSKKRQVALVGEAYFEVVHNDDSPFIVSSKNIQTRVLGTKFNVRARAEEEKVVTTLLKGSVCVDIPGGEQEGLILKPGQMLNVNSKTLQSELVDSSRARDVLLWINGKLTFDKAAFVDITSCLEKHFDVSFHFQDEQLKKEVFTCEFHTDNDINNILAVLSLTKHFQYKIEGKDVYLSAVK